ncbi:MAG: acyl-CoA dehydrogenase, partial [Desulfobacteraceae bacterium]|nr:acyl-CoA dehydrogenase [Desulfobacteraceae bacterium]MBC2757851.1 acyl-CoA dehydrogenase [Desulfobacteraceae bacterium]
AACQKMIKRPDANMKRFEKVLKEHVYSLIDAYEMNP